MLTKFSFQVDLNCRINDVLGKTSSVIILFTMNQLVAFLDSTTVIIVYGLKKSNVKRDLGKKCVRRVAVPTWHVKPEMKVQRYFLFILMPVKSRHVAKKELFD